MRPRLTHIASIATAWNQTELPIGPAAAGFAIYSDHAILQKLCGAESSISMAADRRRLTYRRRKSKGIFVFPLHRFHRYYPITNLYAISPKHPHSLRAVADIQVRPSSVCVPEDISLCQSQVYLRTDGLLARL